jgi:predicted deacetylase
MRYIRIDDFPHGDRTSFLKYEGKPIYRNYVKDVLNIFEECNAPYILGVSPLLLQEGDIEFLNRHVINGNVCMHGFDHGFHIEPEKQWGSFIAGYWSKGGEFWDMSMLDVFSKYQESNDILNKVNKYTKDHFIPPFNSFNQNLVDALKETEVKYIHSQTQEYEAHKQKDLDYGDLELVVAPWKTYNHVNNVVENVKGGAEGQICLHWTYDTMENSSRWLKADWKDLYYELGNLISEQ